jgi:hypothetical protein
VNALVKFSVRRIHYGKADPVIETGRPAATKIDVDEQLPGRHAPRQSSATGSGVVLGADTCASMERLRLDNAESHLSVVT